MKKTHLINSELSYLIATLGHTDEITIADAGLPIPNAVKRIDLALVHGVPSFIDTVVAVLSEMQVEGVVIAEEIKQQNPKLHQDLLVVLDNERALTDRNITVSYVSHEDFKGKTQASKAVVRSGECTPYANVIFQAGVAF